MVGSESFGDSAHASGQRAQPNQNEDEQARKIFTAFETRAVNGLRVVVFLLLMTTTVLVSVGVGIFTRQDEEDDFKKQFYGYAGRIVDSFDEKLESRLAAFDAAAVSLTSYSIATANDTRLGWEAYAAENEKWLDEAFFREIDQKTRQDARFNLSTPERRQLMKDRRGLQLDGYRPKIYDLSEGLAPSPDGSGPFFVYWQMLETGEAVLDKAANLLEEVEGEAIDQTRQVTDFFVKNSQYRHEIKACEGSPLSNLAYPVFDGFGEDRKVAGALFTNVFWRLDFVDVLPESTAGVIAVVSNTCNQTFSFLVSGDSVSYLGPNDVHDPKRTGQLEVKQLVAISVNARASPRNRAYTTVGLDRGFCDYSLAVYPSQELEDRLLTNESTIYTLVVASIFVFTSLVFVTYDLLVARRQRIVMTKAIKTGAIVSSLFPENVQSRLFDHEQPNVKPWLDSQVNFTPGNPNEMKTGAGKEDAIADLFPHCTVLFADVAGFTGYRSSGREPKDAFKLLETMFGSFDALALKRNVFKVETIDDCHMAVTGLPELPLVLTVSSPPHRLGSQLYPPVSGKGCRQRLHLHNGSHLYGEYWG